MPVSARAGSAPPAVRAARRLVDSWGSPAFRSRQPYQIKVIEADGVTLTLYENMLDLVSERKTSARARSVVLGRLPPEGLCWTRSAEARELEEQAPGSTWLIIVVGRRCPPAKGRGSTAEPGLKVRSSNR